MNSKLPPYPRFGECIGALASALDIKKIGSDVGRLARVRETLSTAITTDSGTAPVGRRSPNAWNLYDMAGNAAELTATIDADEQAHVHGGSWSDPVAATRASNASTLPPFAGHQLVGMRVVVRP